MPPTMLPSLLYRDQDAGVGHGEGSRARAAGKWSESTETLNEYGSDTSPIPIPLPLPLDEAVFPSLSTRPGKRMLLTFECDKRRRSTRLTFNGQVIYSFASLYENPSSKAEHFTQLRNKDGKVVATHIMSPNEAKQLVKFGDSAPVSRKAWLPQCGILSMNCGKFQVGKRWFKWRCLNESGRVSVVLRDHSSKSTPTVARFNCIHRIEPATLIAEGPNATRPSSRGHSRTHSTRRNPNDPEQHPRSRQSRSWRAHLELDPDYQDIWDHVVFSLIVLESLKGGRRIPPLEYEDESGSNVSYLANLIGLFATTV